METKCIHAGQPSDPRTGAVVVPISLATTFQQSSPGVHKGYEYSRTGNPTREAYEACVAGCENAKYGVAFASGSATTMTVMNMLKAGDKVVVMNDCYGGTFRYFTKVASKFGIEFVFVDLTDAAALEPAVKATQCKMVWAETPTNPTLKLVDIAAASKVCKKYGCLLVVDNTFMSPYFQNPMDLGADMVVHSVTKFINGHSDVVGGVAVMDDEELYNQMKFLQNSIGAVPSAFDSFLVLRGMKTLAVRMKRHGENAMAVAEFLSGHPKVEKVLYPGLPSHPQHELAKKQMKGFGGMVTFYLKGDIASSREFLENLSLFKCAESLGCVESLIELPVIMTHAAVPREERLKLGITDNLCRLSVGLECIEELLADLDNALGHVSNKKARL